MHINSNSQSVKDNSESLSLWNFHKGYQVHSQSDTLRKNQVVRTQKTSRFLTPSRPTLKEWDSKCGSKNKLRSDNFYLLKKKLMKTYWFNTILSNLIRCSIQLVKWIYSITILSLKKKFKRICLNWIILSQRALSWTKVSAKKLVSKSKRFNQWECRSLWTHLKRKFKWWVRIRKRICKVKEFRI